MTVDPIIAGTIAWAVVFGVASAWLAHRRDRLVPAWALFGAILGPVGLVLLWVAPPGRCASCRAPVRGWITECEWCGMDVRGRNAAERSASRPLISVAPTLRPAIDRTQPIATAPPPAKAPKASKAAKASPAKASAAATAAAATAASVNGGPSASTTAPATSASTTAADAPTGPAPAAAGGRRSSAVPVADPGAVPIRRDQQVITSGVYVTGTVGLSAGSRYTITHDGVDLQVLGPSDRSPRKVAYERPLDGVDATAPEDRLILTAAGGRGGTVLVFMSVEGDPSRIAGDLMAAARSAGKAGVAS